MNGTRSLLLGVAIVAAWLGLAAIADARRQPAAPRRSEGCVQLGDPSLGDPGPRCTSVESRPTREPSNDAPDELEPDRAPPTRGTSTVHTTPRPTLAPAPVPHPGAYRPWRPGADAFVGDTDRTTEGLLRQDARPYHCVHPHCACGHGGSYGTLHRHEERLDGQIDRLRQSIDSDRRGQALVGEQPWKRFRSEKKKRGRGRNGRRGKRTGAERDTSAPDDAPQPCRGDACQAEAGEERCEEDCEGEDPADEPPALPVTPDPPPNEAATVPSVLPDPPKMPGYDRLPPGASTAVYSEAGGGLEALAVAACRDVFVRNPEVPPPIDYLTPNRTEED